MDNKLVRVGHIMWLKAFDNLEAVKVRVLKVDAEREVATILVLREYRENAFDGGETEVEFADLDNKVDLTKVKYGLVEYGNACAITRIDIPAWRYDGVRWTFELIFEVEKSVRGVDGEGHRASGYALAAVISNPPTKHPHYQMVDIGDTILTPYGQYRIQWYSETNHDNLVLIEC